MKNIIKSFLCAGIAAGVALSASAQVTWINGGTPFTSTNLGEIPDGWSISGTRSAVVTDDTVTFAGNTSAMVPGGGAVSGVFRPGTFGSSGEFHWMFYDDMALNDTGKNIRVGLMRPADGNDGAPRFGAISVDTHVSETNYVWHQGFGFGTTTVARSEGWRHVHLAWDVVGTNTVVDFYIDGVLGATGSLAEVIPTNEWMGSPFGTTTEAWVNIPEPSTYALIFGGLALLGAFVYRRRATAKK